MTSSADIRNWIITLVILGGGVALIFYLGKEFIASAGSPQIPLGIDILTSFDSISLLILAAVAALIIILIPFYASKRSQERKQAPPPKV